MKIALVIYCMLVDVPRWSLAFRINSFFNYENNNVLSFPYMHTQTQYTSTL